MKVSKKILRVDAHLYDIAKQIKILYAINPTNTKWEKKRFLEFYGRRKKYIPKFKYRPVSIDVKKFTSELSSLEKHLDSTELDEMYRRKLDEMNHQILLVSSVGNRDKFFAYSIALYGTPLDTHGAGVKPLDIAKTWLRATRIAEEKYLPAKSKNPRHESVAKELEREARFYGFRCRVLVKDHLSSNAAAGENTISLREDTLYSKKEAVRMCVHEVGFHILTTYNGKQHKLRIFEIGTPGYLFDQEGGAIWAEEVSRSITNYRLAILGARTVGIYLAISGADFHDIFKAMHEKYSFSLSDSFYICERVFRGGLFTKDSIYQLGFYNVLNHFRFELTDPYIFINGKMSLQYMPLVKELMKEGYVEKPKYIPRFLRDEEWIRTWRTLSETHGLFRKEKYLSENKEK